MDRWSLDALEYPRLLRLLARFLGTGLGRAALPRLRPFTEPEQMERALVQAAEAVHYDEAGGRWPLPQLGDVAGGLRAAFDEGRPLDEDLLGGVLRAVRASERFRRAFGAREDFPALRALGRSLPDLEGLAADLESKLDDDGRLLPSASPRLAELSEAVRRLERAIAARLERLADDSRLKRFLQSPQPVWRDGRPALQVKPEMLGRVRGLLLDRSHSGQTAFVLPEALVTDDRRLSELKLDAEAERRRLLAEIRRRLHAARSELERACEGLAWIDLLRAKVRLVRGFGWIVPGRAPDGVFRLREVRHPLLLRDLLEERAPAGEVLERVVPLDLTLGESFHMLVVTGPNTGGKTVALKTLGLCQLMAQSGLPLPAADGTALPCTDGVHADIGDEQTIEQNLSTFSAHLVRIERALSLSTPRSLVLLDELGAGTDPEEGGALGHAILEALDRRRVPTLASTHLGLLKEFAFQRASVENGAMAFDPKTLEPLYRLVIGVVGKSLALAVARRIGLPADLVARAEALLARRDPRVEEMIDGLMKTRRSAEEARRRAEADLQAAAQQAAEIERRAEELERKESWLHEEAAWVAGEELARVRARVEGPLKELANAPAPFGAKARAVLELLTRFVDSADPGRRRARFLERLAPGQTVYVPHLGKRCQIVRKDRRRRRLLVRAGRLEIELGYDDVSWLQPLD